VLYDFLARHYQSAAARAQSAIVPGTLRDVPEAPVAVAC
jgi:hypothetical protein